MTRGLAVGFTLLLLVFGFGCGGRQGPPAPGDSQGAIPDLRGRQVMVLPVQNLVGVEPSLTPDPELGHALRARGGEVEWVFPPEMETMLRRSPGVRAQIRNLPVGVFLQAEVRRIGDPLYGHIRRLAGLTGAEVALLPVELRFSGDEYQIGAAIVDPRSGRVLWYGIVAGGPGRAQDPGTLASAIDALARTLLPWG